MFHFTGWVSYEAYCRGAIMEMTPTHPQLLVPLVRKLKRVKHEKWVRAQVILRSTIAVVLFNWGTTYESSFTFYNSKVKGDGYDVLQWHVISSNGHPSMCINKDSTKHDKTDVLSAQFLKLNLHLKAHTAAGHNKKTPVVNNASQHCDKYHRFRSSNESHLLANLYHLLKLTHALLWTPPIPAVCSLWCYQRGHHTGQHVYS